MNTDHISRRQLLLSASQNLYHNPIRSSPNIDGVVVRARAGARIPIFLKPDQVESLLSTPMCPRDLNILRLLYFCALRVSEVMGLRVEDVDFEARVIKVCHAVTPSGMPKEYKERLVPIDKKTLALIKVSVGSRTHGRLFKIGPRQVQRMIKTYAREAGISNWRQITPHKLRHSFATHYYHHTRDLLGLQKMLGHATVSATEIYTHVDLEDIKVRYSAVLKALKSKQVKPVTLSDIYKILLRIDKRLSGR